MGINEVTREDCDYGYETRWFGYGGRFGANLY